MTTIKNLASWGDCRTWSGYACSGTGHGLAVRAEIEADFVVVTVAGQQYECDRPRDITFGDIRGIMLAAVSAYDHVG